PPPSHELGGRAEGALQRRHLVAAAVHDAHRRRRRAPRRVHHRRQPGVVLRSAAELDHAHHAGNPIASSSPASRLPFCTACPAAPFTRLSIAATTITVGCRTPAAVYAVMRATLRCTTSRSAGTSSVISTNGSDA